MACSCRLNQNCSHSMFVVIQYDSAEWKSAFLRQAREFLFFALLPWEASTRVSIFESRTGSKPERLRSGFLQADLSLIVKNDPPARVSAQAPRFFVIYDSQFPLASSRFGRDSIQFRVGKTHCQGHQDPSKSVPVFLRGTEQNLKMVPIGGVPIPRNRTVIIRYFCSCPVSSSVSE